MAAGVLIVLFLAVYFIYRPKNKQYIVPDTSHWQTGDLFFSTGDSWKSSFVRMFGGNSDNNTSHCGFVMMLDGKPMLVHMSADKGEIVVESPEEYGSINNAVEIHVMRLKEMPDTVILRKRLNELIKDHKTFDSSFNHNDADSYYCTELIVRELSASGCHGFEPLLKQKYIYPQELESSDMLIAVQ